ncbi:hypothetical protein G9A89_022962 [Geosiphon pyriformis]|nr:hypothetical protein G9A89_022962 [Geosiphon pyriformis]
MANNFVDLSSSGIKYNEIRICNSTGGARKLVRGRKNEKREGPFGDIIVYFITPLLFNSIELQFSMMDPNIKIPKMEISAKKA